MESTRFDQLTSTFAARSTRRSALRSLAAMALGAGVLPTLARDTTDAKNKKACPPCKKRKQGKCKGTLPDGTPCSGGTCQGGSCVAPPSPPAPANECAALSEGALCGFRGCMVCRNGACVVDASREGGTCGNGGCLICLNGVCSTNPKNNDTCGVGGGGRCYFGACNPKPTCTGTEAMCAGGPASCCSGRCGGGACGLVGAGGQCKRGEDCTSGSCIGYRCQ